ncbi:FAD binding domain-containing protein [Cupriavidus necator]
MTAFCTVDGTNRRTKISLSRVYQEYGLAAADSPLPDSEAVAVRTNSYEYCQGNRVWPVRAWHPTALSFNGAARLLPAVRLAYSGYVAWRGTVPDASLDPAIAAVFAEAITYNVRANSLILLYPQPRAGWFGRARRAAAQIRLVPQLPRGRRPLRTAHRHDWSSA